MALTIAGQWHGGVEGTPYHLCLEIDDLGTTYSGRACLYEDNSPFVVATQIHADKRSDTFQSKVRLEYQRIANVAPLSIAKLKEEFPDGLWAETANLRLRLTRRGLLVEIAVDGKEGKQLQKQVTLTASLSDRISRLKSDRSVRTWEKFKSMVGALPRDQYIFRGQPVLKRLRSSFHRTPRKDLSRYINVDIPRLHKVLSANTRHLFDLADDNQYAAFWNLLQHHGYPTPLLDWTHSPYVAAYFAFRAQRASDTGGNVRIFMFDAQNWKSDYPQLQAVVNVQPHFSLLEPFALENTRALPQQALSAVTTVDDVEGYLDQCGKAQGKTYLKAVDLPYSARTNILRELRLMGITAASLFPGIDGTCEAMRHQMFEDL
ncbi:FRG domain-containing protein (plasmid) [Rhizobium leguminosarum]|uniref:FRG domain-containing protein n=1 Tax=Rhizobium leguminosarum TaxID=384 RepID=UPI001032078E|nr:FRG domain-containing protein [Rhizobium leguminosarum]TBF68276.1 FRG domain-containing protein [Rhizobium leguminosarum]TBG52004.1 FRG domain-containing protein [Rhizobium leguminosarum]TBH32831.1 FRG domain-containing protein [Rhizobium leguminosarum]